MPILRRKRTLRASAQIHNLEMGALIGSVDQILVIVMIGGAAGWLAATFLRVRSIGIAGTVVVGVVGSFIGIVLFRAVDIRIEGYQIGPIPVGHLFAAFVGAVLLVIVFRLFRWRR